MQRIAWKLYEININTMKIENEWTKLKIPKSNFIDVERILKFSS